MSLGGSPSTSEVVTWQIYRLGFNYRSTADKHDRPDVCNLTSSWWLRNIAWNSDGGMAIAYGQVRMNLLANLHSPPFPRSPLILNGLPIFLPIEKVVVGRRKVLDPLRYPTHQSEKRVESWMLYASGYTPVST